MSLAAKDYGDLQNSTTYNKMDCIMKNIIKSNVSWVGYIDWELQQFHGDEYSIINGSSQNAYLIEEEKTVLIDTIWVPHRFEFIENLKTEIDLSKLDYVVANHG